MDSQFNIAEIFTFAEQIERNGARFYRRAADFRVDSGQCRLLLDLAHMEEQHEKVFARMKAEITQPDENEGAVFDPNTEAARFLQAFADGHVFDLHADPTEQLRGDESLAQILRIAIGLEKDSIVFYLGMKDYIPETWGREHIQRIITEEMKHIADLSDLLKSIN